MKIININGMHRSGTMLMSRLINALPDTFIVKDGIRIPWYYFRVETKENFSYPIDCYKKNPLKLDLTKPVFDINHLRSILLEEATYLKFIPELYKCWKLEIEAFKQGVSYIDIFSRLYSKMSDILQVGNVGTKNTQMFRYKKDVLEAFPNLKWIDIIRDPRGWYCSVKVSHPTNIFSSALMWNRAVNTIPLTKDFFETRYILVTFEDLIINRKKTLQKICNFMEIDFTISDRWIENLNLIENDGSPWFSNSSYTKKGKKIFGDQNKRKSTDYEVLDTHPVFRWKKKLSFIEKAILKIATGKNLKRIKIFE